MNNNFSEEDLQKDLMQGLMTGTLKKEGDGFVLTDKGEAEVEEILLHSAEAIETIFALTFADLKDILDQHQQDMLMRTFSAAMKQIYFKDDMINRLFKELGFNDPNSQ